jgi:hypothetical protein
LASQTIIAWRFQCNYLKYSRLPMLCDGQTTSKLRRSADCWSSLVLSMHLTLTREDLGNWVQSELMESHIITIWKRIGSNLHIFHGGRKMLRHAPSCPLVSNERSRLLESCSTYVYGSTRYVLPFQPTYLHLVVMSSQVPTTYLVKTQFIWHAVVQGSY